MTVASERELVTITLMLSACPVMAQAREGERVKEISVCGCLCACKGVQKSSKEDFIEKERGKEHSPPPQKKFKFKLMQECGNA